MTDRDALFAAVLAAPDDDTPRLVFADYLDDTGAQADAVRARFIRDQIALSRAEPWTEDADRLHRETFAVALRYGKDWNTGAGGIVLSYRFSRGFVGEVTCYSKRFVADGAGLVAAQPVRAVKFADMSGGRGAATAEQLAASPLLARLHLLHLVGTPVDDAFVDRLLKSPHLSGLQAVRIERSGLGPAGLARLLTAGPRPAELDLSGNPTLNDGGLDALAGASGFRGVRVLDLHDTGFGVAGVRALAANPNAAGLEVLRFGHGMDSAATPFRGPGAVALAASPHLRGLTELVLSGQELRKRGAEAFAAAYAWPGLRRLGLRGNGILPTALPAFAANPLLRSLTAIDFRGNPIRADHLAPLRAAFPGTRFLTDDTAPHPYANLATEDRP